MTLAMEDIQFENSFDEKEHLEEVIGEESNIEIPEPKNYRGTRNEEGQRHGFGKAIFPNGDIYKGKYVNNQRHGYGTYVYKNAKYIGKWKNNKKEGIGTILFPDGSVYKGHFHENIRHGYGQYYYNNGDVYIGEWQSDKRNGYGTYSYSKLCAKYSGNWTKDRMNGQGEMAMGNCIFIGSFKNNRPGKGKFVFKNESEQTGEFVPRDSNDLSKGLIWKGGKIDRPSVRGGMLDVEKFHDEAKEEVIPEPVVDLEEIGKFSESTSNMEIDKMLTQLESDEEMDESIEDTGFLV